MIRDSWTRSGLPIHLLWQIWSLTGIPNGKRELEVRLADPGHRVRLGTRDGGEINGQAAVRRVRVRALRARRMVDRLLHRPSFLPSFLSVASNADRAAAAAGYLPTAEVTKAPKPTDGGRPLFWSELNLFEGQKRGCCGGGGGRNGRRRRSGRDSAALRPSRAEVSRRKLWVHNWLRGKLSTELLEG